MNGLYHYFGQPSNPPPLNNLRLLSNPNITATTSSSTTTNNTASNPTGCMSYGNSQASMEADASYLGTIYSPNTAQTLARTSIMGNYTYVEEKNGDDYLNQTSIQEKKQCMLGIKSL